MMRKKSLNFYFLLAILWAYTTFKVLQSWPSHLLEAAILTYLIFVVMIGWMFVYRSNPMLFNSIWFRAYAWGGSLTMGLWATFMLISIPFDIVFLAIYLLRTIFHISYYDPQKIVWLSQTTEMIIFTASFIICVLGLIETLRGPRVKSISVAMDHLPAALKGLKIAQISDLHVGPTIHKDYVEKVVRRTNATNPDLIFITGDLADGKTDVIESHLQPLASLKSRLGIYFVTGNHEYYYDPKNLLNKVKDMGFVTLINENRIVNMNGSRVLIAGVTDPVGANFTMAHRPDLNQAAQTTEETQLKILLAHRPDTAIEAEKFGFNLQFSGHTHAGQFFPFNLLVSFSHQYYHKLNRHGRLWIYVNPGTGYWGPANRFGIPSEISLLTLKDSKDQ